MEINYLGHSCFKISGKKITVLIDPYDPAKVGPKLPKQDAEVVTISHQHTDHNYLQALKTSEYLLLDSPGEYEVRETEILGIASNHGDERGGNTIFTFDVDDVKVCHLGDLGTELSSEQLDKMDGVDILMIPVGGYYTIDAKTAVKVVSQVEPKIVIPMHYKTAGSLIKELAPIDDFLHEMSVQPSAQEKLKVTTKDLPEELEVVVLKA
jgi:L-ascorbate metabolism protein UlaG (beta-lactamase superfamily)